MNGLRMMKLKQNDFTGYSESSMDEAIHNALQKAGSHSHVRIIETQSSQLSDKKRFYQVTLAIKGV
ncbi:hypothetical protein [Legionella sp. CNM-4043-24]|uniref:hypothetical protein n=1 Tax=Legionella sp. CNM-4043-24 TaxID=3421646 RepID=UPI00403B2E7A